MVSALGLAASEIVYAGSPAVAKIQVRLYFAHAKVPFHALKAALVGTAVRAAGR